MCVSVCLYILGAVVEHSDDVCLFIYILGAVVEHSDDVPPGVGRPGGHVIHGSQEVVLHPVRQEGTLLRVVRVQLTEINILIVGDH